jgi:putative signal transducing protein
MADTEAIWTAKTDDELLEAAGELSEYTEEGERIIRAELERRGLPQPDPPIGQCSRCGRSIARNQVHDECSQCGEPFPPEILRVLGAQTREAALVPILRTGDPGLIPLAKSLLEGEGIEYLVRGENLQDLFGAGRLGGYNYVTGPAEFWVHTEDAERARTLLDELDALPPELAADPNDDA